MKWVCIFFSKSLFDLGCISVTRGCGGIQDWDCIQADTVFYYHFAESWRILRGFH